MSSVEIYFCVCSIYLIWVRMLCCLILTVIGFWHYRSHVNNDLLDSSKSGFNKHCLLPNELVIKLISSLMILFEIIIMYSSIFIIPFISCCSFPLFQFVSSSLSFVFNICFTVTERSFILTTIIHWVTFWVSVVVKRIFVRYSGWWFNNLYTTMVEWDRLPSFESLSIWIINFLFNDGS